MHGLGNDFMVLDRVSKHFDLPSERIKALGDRRTGVGFDQLLIVDPPETPDIDFTYTIYNSDGSRAEQCGNGARCFVRFVLDNGLTVKKYLRLQTSTGAIGAALQDSGLVEIDMGVPTHYGPDLPFGEHLDEEPPDAHDNSSSAAPALQSVAIEDQEFQFLPVSMGNPHAVIEVGDVSKAPVEKFGYQLATHSLFPAGVNVGFCQYVDRSFARLRVFERGAGETRACGTGACAAVVAGIAQGKLDSKVKVSLPGGKLRIVWNGPGQTVKMLGPTATVFRGEFSL
jgi:diaminopimelate epimerase